MGPPGLRSLRNKVALLFAGITAAAFGVMWFYVVPQLETTLEKRKLEELRADAAASTPTLEGLMGRRTISARELDRRVRAVADAAGARVTLLGVQRSVRARPDGAVDVRFFVITDSREERRVPENDALSRRALERRDIQTARVASGGERLGQLAQPLELAGRADWVALYTRDFADVRETVSFIRDRVLVATAAALLVALVGGWLVAQALSRRVRRLERGAEAVASGRFIDPLPVDSDDELGQLTRAFNDMQEQLRRVDVARKEFVATASHELRTPIFSLAGFVELLQDEELDEETRRDFLEAMREQIGRLQKLSVDLLDLSRMDAGSLELEREPVDLSEVARLVVREFGPALVEHGTELDARLPETGVEARGDRERIVQIVRILLDNALHHTPQGTLISVTAARADGAAAVTVADGGPGIGAGAAGHVFERFYTGDAARGAGLGLAIAQELAERMGGRLTLRSQPGETRFTLELPISDADAASARSDATGALA